MGPRLYGLLKNGDIQLLSSISRLWQHKYQNFSIPGCSMMHTEYLIIQHRHQSSTNFETEPPQC